MNNFQDRDSLPSGDCQLRVETRQCLVHRRLIGLEVYGLDNLSLLYKR
jgi:hypothetical protein